MNKIVLAILMIATVCWIASMRPRAHNCGCSDHGVCSCERGKCKCLRGKADFHRYEGDTAIEVFPSHIAPYTFKK